MKPCDTCRYWLKWKYQPHTGIILGDCRHGAPKIFQKARSDNPMEDTYTSKWPATRIEDCCGVHAVRREEVAAVE